MDRRRMTAIGVLVAAAGLTAAVTLPSFAGEGPRRAAPAADGVDRVGSAGAPDVAGGTGSVEPDGGRSDMSSPQRQRLERLMIFHGAGPHRSPGRGWLGRRRRPGRVRR
ncbi:hypothetical protein [Micromonospora maritima]|uniref:hypothetical protein n=1 Tax=Micromonospora maritima TaxID=986711 RepID=UPI001FEA4CFB|nr:hypothetical protein [Micromonospora maritima]